MILNRFRKHEEGMMMRSIFLYTFLIILVSLPRCSYAAQDDPTVKFEITQVLEDCGAVSDIAMHKDKIVWKVSDQIYLFSLPDAVKTNISGHDSVKGDPAIYEDKIIWTEPRNLEQDMPYCDIYEFSYDGSDPNKIQITTSDSYKRYAAISDNKIAWEDYRDGCWDIFIHDGLTEKRLLALNDPGGMAISADNIIFIGRRPGTDNKNVPGLYIYDIVNNVQRFLTAARPISRPSIYNDKIVWSEMSEIAAYPLPEKRIIIYLYDISNSVKMVITGLKSSERIQSDPVIYEDRIAYVYKRADGLNDIVVGIIYSMPSIRTIDIAEAAIGDIITITGENFGYKKRDSSVIFTDGVTASVYENDWTDSQIRVRVPSNAASGTLKVVTNGGDSNEVYIKVKPQPSISIELNELFWKLGKMRLGERKSNAGDMGIPMHAITNTGNVPVMIDIGYGPWAHSIIHPGYEQGQDTFVTLTERSVMPPYGRMAIMDLDPGVTRPLRLTYGAPVKLSEASDGMSAVYEIRAYLMRR